MIAQRDPWIADTTKGAPLPSCVRLRHGGRFVAARPHPSARPLRDIIPDRFRYDLASALRHASPSMEPVAEPTRRQINRIAGVGTDEGEDRRPSWPIHTDKDRRATLQHH